MAVDLGLDVEIAAVNSVADADVDWAQNVATALDAAFDSATNPFGTAAVLNTGTAAGNIPKLNASGKIPPGVLPDASQSAKGAAEIATNAEVLAGTDATKIVTPAGLYARTATNTRTGIARFATAAEAVAALPSATLLMSPKRTKEVAIAAVEDAPGGAYRYHPATPGVFTEFGQDTIFTLTGDNADYPINWVKLLSSYTGGGHSVIAVFDEDAIVTFRVSSSNTSLLVLRPTGEVHLPNPLSSATVTVYWVIGMKV